MQEKEKLLKKLTEYEEEHRDLDQIIIQIQERNTIDFLPSPSLSDFLFLIELPLFELRLVVVEQSY